GRCVAAQEGEELGRRREDFHCDGELAKGVRVIGGRCCWTYWDESPATDEGGHRGSSLMGCLSLISLILLRHDRVEGLDPAGATLGPAGLSVGAGDYYDEEDGAKASGSGGIAIQDDSDGEDGGDDPAYFSQAGIALGDDDEEASGTFRQRYDNDEDDGADEAGDIETVVPAPKRVTVTVKKRLIPRGLYYIDARGREVDTDRSDWRRVSNGESTSATQAPAAPTTPASNVTTASPVPPIVTAGAGKNLEAGALAAIGGLASLLLAV
ncbi:hypothetical protein GE09DRAFT_1269848, partial [Coniochaeta sp. 2T2.1]